jgi:hypothetical protein
MSINGACVVHGWLLYVNVVAEALHFSVKSTGLSNPFMCHVNISGACKEDHIIRTLSKKHINCKVILPSVNFVPKRRVAFVFTNNIMTPPLVQESRRVKALCGM